MAKLYAKAPDGSDALLSIVITGFTQSLQQNGWCKLPNGLLIQWSKLTNVGSFSLKTYTLPISYTNYLVINICRESGNNQTEYAQSIYSYTTAVIKIMGREGNGHLIVLGH